MNFLKKYYPALTGLFVFIVYLSTLAPTVVQIDSGELSTVQLMPGVAHPTGYPLFTITGYLFSLIPLPFTKIYQMNLLAAIWCALGVIVFVSTARMILTNIDSFKSAKKEIAKKISKKDKKLKQVVETPAVVIEKLPEIIVILASVAGGLMLAFSKTYWFQSTSVEVYSLHVFLILLVIYFLLKAFIVKSDSFSISLKNYWILFALMLALSFSNHLTTLLILPAVAVIYFNKYGFNKTSFRQIGIMLLFFFPMLILLYSYLPLMASQQPLINWGNPIDLERILRHISGKQYQGWLFSSTESAKKQLTYFIENLPVEFFISLILAAAGLIYSFMKVRKLFYFLTTAFVFTVLYSINYDINDIDAYFLLAFISVAFFCVAGVLWLFSLLNTVKSPAMVTSIVVIILVGVQAYTNYGKADQSQTYVFEDYTRAVVNSVEPNSIIFSYQWDYFISPAYYLQYIEGFRKDVIIVDKELLRRSWYYNQLQTQHPDLLDNMQPDVTQFLKALEPFERSETYDANLLENLFRRIMTDLVATNIEKRNFYIAPEVLENEMKRGEFTLPKGYTIVPDLFFFKVVKTQDYHEAPEPDYTLRFPENRNYYIDSIEKFAGSMLARRALYEMEFDKLEKARLYLGKLKREFPHYNIPQSLQDAILN
ncbi:MAG: DUF2723 domain-containing protein [Ignavibacteriales bacterium]|nr:MAG: DUF2723 domain-containing protein [Ignavibacteriales bacterium]